MWQSVSNLKRINQTSSLMKKEDIAAATILCSPLIVFLVFLVLRLTDLIRWSWWWVTVPLWGTVGIVMIFALVYTSILFYKIHNQ